MKTPLALLLLIPSLSWGLTFKDGKQVDSEVASETTLKDNFQSSNNKSIFISDSELNEFLNLSNNHKLKACGYNNFKPNWEIIDKDLDDRISGYNSRMDNNHLVEGEFSKEVFSKFIEAAMYAQVSSDLEIKERLFEKLYHWSNNEALLGTTICYNRNPNDKVRPHCEGEWSDPDGQDLAPIKDASVSLDIALGLNYIYPLFFLDYKADDFRHETIKKYLKKWQMRFPPSPEFYWGVQMAWMIPNIHFKNQNNKKYIGEIKNMIKGANRWMNKDGSLKDRTTRGNRALWYHHTAVAEAFLAMEMARAHNVELPKDYEEKFLNAVDLFHKAYLDNSYITKWAKKGHNSQFDKNKPDYQSFNRDLSSIAFGGYWFWGFQYRYPEHPFSQYLEEELPHNARNLKADDSIGVPLGCIYNSLAKPEGYEPNIKPEIIETECTPTKKLAFKEGTNTPIWIEVCD